MARRRRTANIQRRERASNAALNRRLDDRGLASGLPDWRLLAIGGLLAVGLVLVVVVLVMGSGPNPNAGTTYPSAGGDHVTQGNCRDAPSSCTVQATGRQLQADPYTSLPATSGPHWDVPAAWGVYTTPQPESRLVHNLEHGGVVIWYDPERVEPDGIADLARYVEARVAEGSGGRFKFILTPWGGEQELPSAIVATAWQDLLNLDEANTDAIDGFADAHYGEAPEPQGGPAPGQNPDAMP